MILKTTLLLSHRVETQHFVGLNSKEIIYLPLLNLPRGLHFQQFNGMWHLQFFELNRLFRIAAEASNVVPWSEEEAHHGTLIQKSLDDFSEVLGVLFGWGLCVVQDHQDVFVFEKSSYLLKDCCLIHNLGWIISLFRISYEIMDFFTYLKFKPS